MRTQNVIPSSHCRPLLTRLPVPSVVALWSMALIDNAVYTDVVPHVSLRQIFVKSNVTPEDRVLIAKAGFINPELIANLADNMETFQTAIQTVFSPEQIGNVAVKLIKLATLATMWRHCKTLVTLKDDQHLKLQEDPMKIPEIGVMEYGEYRESFTKGHTDVVLTDWREPHKRFLERLLRDLAVHQVVPFYELGEIRLRAENVVQTTGIAPTAELLLKVARVDSPASVTCEDDALNRIHAYLVALEYAGQLSFADFRKTAGGHTGGALTYIRELETRRRETPGLAFIINVDRKIRKKVHQLLVEQRSAYSTYSDALYEVLTNCAIYWTEARLDSRDPPVAAQGKPQETTVTKEVVFVIEPTRAPPRSQGKEDEEGAQEQEGGEWHQGPHKEERQGHG